MVTKEALTPLARTAEGQTDYWNDSCSVKELSYAIERGAVGATTNPTIVLGVLKMEAELWEDRIGEIIGGNPTWSEVEVAWKVIEEMAVQGAGLLKPVYDREGGRKGLLSIQTNPQFYRNAQAITDQAVYFSTLAPNIQVKIPATKAGIEAIEEATYHGVSINATVCFTVAQSIAVAEAVERGLSRREQEGKPVDKMSPVCTIMVGRVDDWLQVVEKRDGVLIHPGYTQWGGVAVFKHAYDIFQARGYRARLLAAAYRHHLHWSELIGGDIVLTIPYDWQVRFNNSDIEVADRIDDPVDPHVLAELKDKFPDFVRAYEEDGLRPEEFDSYGATVRTLRGFIASYHELMGVLRERMLPNPDVKR
jgi:transaldolase